MRQLPIDCLSGPIGYIPYMIAAEQDLNYWQARCAYFDRQDGNAVGAVHFIGDSLIDGMDISPACAYALPRGIGGDTFRGGLNRVNRGGTANSIHRAGAVVWMLGLNDCCYEGDGGLLNVPYMWDQLAPAISGKWVISHNLPVAAGNIFASNGKTGAQINACLDIINAYIDNKFAGNSNIAIVNVKSQLAPNGYLAPENTIDGVHLSKAGCDIWTTAVATALASLGVN